MLKTIIFDMDGVIIDSEPQHAKAAVRTFKELGADVDIEYCYSFIGSSTKKMAETAIKDFSLDISTDELLEKLNKTKKEMHEKEGYIAVPGVIELIKRLYRDGIQLAIASSSSPKEIETVVKKLGIKKYFEKLVSASQVKHPKPAPDTFLLALEKLGASLEDTVIIEDSENGVKAAKECNVTCIGFSSPDAVKPQNLYKADVLIESFDSIDKTFIENTLLRSHGKPIAIASTKRLIIRELAVSDIPQIYTIYSDPQVRKYIDNIDDYLDAEIEKQKAYIQKVYSFYGYGLWGVFGKTSKKLIGRCGFENETIDGKDEIMLSYLLDSEHWGYGYALECCEAALRYAKENLDMNRIVVVIDHDNSRSIKTAEKLGFKYEKDVVFNDKDRKLFSIQL